MVRLVLVQDGDRKVFCVLCAASWVIRYGFFDRSVEDVSSVRRRVRVQRYLCRDCDVTFSFPPAGVVRHKRYDAAVLGRVLHLVLGCGCSLRAALDDVLCSSYSSVRRWVRGFSQHRECIRCEGLGRLGVAWEDCDRSASGVWHRLELLCGGDEAAVFDTVQWVFLRERPLLDVFLGMLRDG